MQASFRDALSDALIAFGKEYPDLVVITPDLAKSIRITKFKELFPERFITAGISEADMISMAAGISTLGLIPVAAGFAMFTAEKPFEQIRNSVAYPDLNVKIVATHGGICVGRDGATHQAIEDIAIMRVLPNLTVLVAADAVETRAALKAAIEHHGPVYLRLGRDAADIVYSRENKFVIGRADLLKHGKDVSIVACGMMVSKALKAAVELEKINVSARVINMHSIKPLDKEIIISAAKETGGIVAVEDHSRIGGLGSAIAELVTASYPVPLEQVAIDDKFGESGEMDELFQKYGLEVENIVAAAQKILARKINH